MFDKNVDGPHAPETGQGFLQAQRGNIWKISYNRYGSRAILLNELRLQGFVACVIQLVVTLGLQGGWYARFYHLDKRLEHVPVPTMVFAALLSCLGLVGLALLKSLLLGIHAVSSLALGAALGAYHTGVYMLLAERCELTQSSFRGCNSCVCAATNTCTRAALGDPSCAACRAWPTDVCAKANGFFPYMGLLVLLFTSLPAVFSLLVLMRLEKAHSDLASRVLYARALVLRELERLRTGVGLSVEVRVLIHMMATLMRHGSPRDRGPVGSCCELLQLDPGLLEVEWQDVEAQRSRSKWVSTTAAYTASGPPWGSGSSRDPDSAALAAVAPAPAGADSRPRPTPPKNTPPSASTGAIPPGRISLSVSPLGAAPLVESGATRLAAPGEAPAAPPSAGAAASTPTPGPGFDPIAAAGATEVPPQAGGAAAQQQSFLWHKVGLLGSSVDQGSEGPTRGRAPAGDAAVPGLSPERHAGGGSGKGPGFGAGGVASSGIPRQTTGSRGSWATRSGPVVDGLIDSQTAGGKVEELREVGEVGGAAADLKGAEDQLTFAPWKPTPSPPRVPSAAAAAARGFGGDSDRLAGGSPSQPPVSTTASRRNQIITSPTDGEAKAASGLGSISGSGSGYGMKDGLLPGKVPEEVAEEADPDQVRHFKTPRSLTKARTNRQLF
ncbi:hypothetical protein VaNZ11_004735 [Volvox africanus]|uniref:Uncharacterized protein n=1 Tax=Volvox africanus TaxID=51714 RepID=A0ABQ5RX01_9CHLO|nr:hypothetical protein VaNZ11_004735 [Volvox africanus]